MQQRIITQYYVLTAMFALGAMFTMATYVTFLAEKGLNLFEINLANAVFFTTLFVCEIPTGVFADIFGRKRSFVIACFLLAAGDFTYGSSHRFWGFACAEILAAVSSTFKNGAFQAWLVDGLKHHGRTDGLEKIFGRASLYEKIVGSGACIAGAYIGSRRPELPWFICGACAALTGITALTIMREEYFVHKKPSLKRVLQSVRTITASSIRIATENKAVRFVLVITFIQILAVQPINMYWQPFFGAHGVPEEDYGYIFAGILGSLASGAFLVAHIGARGKEKRLIILTQMCAGILVGLTASISLLPVALGLFFLHEIGRGFWQPVKDSYLHSRIPSSERATIASLCSTSPHIGGVFGLVASGAIAQTYGISVAWTISAGILIAGSLFFMRNSSRSKD